MRVQHDFVGHNVLEFGDASPRDGIPINNVIYRTADPELKWIETTTEKIGRWRALFRSTYIGWAVTINGLHVASEKYSDPSWIKNHAFQVSSVREGARGAAIRPIAIWNSKKAADAHRKPLGMICAYGLVDLYSCLEEFVFDIYRAYLQHEPSVLMQGKEYVALRALCRNKHEDPDAWEKALSERLDGWQRKRLYDGLGRVFRSYCDHTGIKKPSWYKQTDTNTWGECIEAIATLRNCLTHGADAVPKELATFSEKPYRMGFDFKVGEPIVVELHHLMNVECFCDALLTGLNASLIERAEGSLAEDSRPS